ncbi:MAG: carboxylesterase family protein [Chitinophagaceae bacterium]|nr:carboxylesterase family protein [Chitinophagaceae bacterium]
MTTLFKIALAFFTLFFFTSTASTQTISIKKVKTDKGFISGVDNEDNSVKIFKGIPFAAPPVGDLRWKDPQPVKRWKGILKCDKFGPNAKQNPPVPFDVYTEEFLIPVNGDISEDCLYLNVWTGAKSTNEKLPVIVFIHGGAFIVGSGSVPIYDGEAMAKKGVVFVTINYRLGVFGFYAHPELTKESPHHTSGNYGLLDQVAALQWVKKNIAAFGGDPENVTIAGQSAGSISVNVLSVSERAKGLFHKIIAESGATVVRGRFGGTTILDTAESRGLQFAQKAGAKNLKELRQLSADSLLKAFSGIGIVIVDGYLLTEPVSASFAKNKQYDLPLMTGYTADEVNRPWDTTLTGFKKYLSKEFKNDSLKVFRYYPASNDEEARNASRSILRDMGFGLQNFAWAAMQGQKKSKSYLYFFNRKVPEYGGTNKYGAFHSGEISYAYDNLKFFNRPFTNADHQLARLMSSFWVNFAKTGDPNGNGLPPWPAFDVQKGEVMIFDAETKPGVHPYYGGLNYFYQEAIKN